MIRLETEAEAEAEDRTLGGGSSGSEGDREGDREEKDIVDGFGYEEEEERIDLERGAKTINFDANGHATGNGNGNGIRNQNEKDEEKGEDGDEDGAKDEGKRLSKDDLNDTRTNSNNATIQPPPNANYTESKRGEREREREQNQGQEQEDPNLIKWAPNDPENPRNWSTAYKSWVTFLLGMLALGASLGSSIISPAEDSIVEDLGVSQEAVVLVISLYIIGFAFGPLLWAPISEIWGPRWSLLPPMVCLSLFSIGTATSKTPTALFITRFFGGVFGSAPVSNVSACLGDIWEPKARGIAVAFYAVAVVGGPTLGPIIGAALTINPHLGWRWTEYVLAIWVFVVTSMGTVFLPEVYAPVLLKRRASAWRKETGNQAFWHPHERVALDVRTVVTKHFSRPLLMLVSEPMVTCIEKAFYASFVYALLYLTLEVFPIVFRENRNWALQTSTLPFLGLFIGVLCAMVINLANAARYARIADAANGKPVPEARLPPMALGAILFTIGLFTFGWTASPQIPWPACVVVTIFIGAGFNTIFQQCINFLVDTYGSNYAASAVSANTFLRSVLAAAFPLVAKPMFRAMGVGPAMSVLGGVAALAVPVPFLFMRFGRSLRRRSRFAPFEG